MQTIRSGDLIGKYDAILLDAYGVLVNQGGAIPGAAAYLQRLTAAEQPWFVLTNDASRLPETIAKRFAGFGLNIPVERIVTSGSLLTDWFTQQNLRGARCLTLGTSDGRAYVERAGGTVVLPTDQDTDAEVVAVCDDSGYDFLPGVEAAMTMVMHRLDADKKVQAVLPNPDIIYPKSADAYGFTAGAAVIMLEAGWRVRFGDHQAPTFTRLGKPFLPIFEAAQKRAGSKKLVLVGDQLRTDIAGAKAFGIDSLLVGTGLTRWSPGMTLTPEPSYYAADLS